MRQQTPGEPAADAAGDLLDVVIVGAGLSGIGAAWHLQNACPERRFTILERRSSVGGTWDLFRYPGIRSDSDMHTLGYEFRPWREAKAIADGPSILRYIRDTAAEAGIDRHIRFNQHVLSANWCSASRRWRLQVRDESTGELVTLHARFVLMCAGYYSYDRAHEPEFEGRARFRGDWVHPQFWPQDLKVRGRRVVVIGSGATAMTLVPALAREGASVVMLQRSPTWVIARPSRDRIANALRRLLPEDTAYALTRWKNTRLQQWFYRRTRVAPGRVRRHLLRRVRAALGPDFDVEQHFTPRYNPWDQRLCLVPDGDLFEVLRRGDAEVVTGEIGSILEQGIALRDGRELPADVIVSATGLELVVMGEVSFSIDGEPVDFGRTWTYKGIMCSGVPNLVSVFGYINASWTLRADLTSRWFCRLLNTLRDSGREVAVPRLPQDGTDRVGRDWIEDFSAGYMRRVMHRLPRQGDRAPWINSQDYRLETELFLRQPVEDGALQLS